MTSSSTPRFLQGGRLIFTSGLFVLVVGLFPQSASALQQPAMYTPSCNSAGTQVTLSWGSVSGASNYPIRVDGPGYCAGNVSGPGNWGCYQGVEYLYETAYSGIALSITPSTSYSWWVHAQNGGAWSPATQQSFSCSPPPPQASCSIWLDSSSISSGSGTYLRWSMSNASYLYISNVGYVYSNGAAYVAPSSSTYYSGTAYGSGGNGSCGATLTVSTPPPPSEPSASASCQSNGDVTVSWGTSSNAATYALRVNNTSTYCNGISGPNNNVGCVSGTDYVEDNISTSVHSRTVTPSPVGSPVTYWVHGVNGSSWSTNTQRSITCTPSPPPEPTGQTTTCSADGTSVTMSWNAVSAPNLIGYPLRLDDTTVNGCSIEPYYHSWYCASETELEVDWQAPNQKYMITATSYTAPIVPGRSYRWWVHSLTNVSGSTEYYWSSTTAHTFSCSAQPTEPANTSAANYSCNAAGTQATVSWGNSTNATSFALRVDNLATGCGGITGPGTNVWCTPAGYFPGYSGQTDYVDDNIPTLVHSRTISINPAYSPVRWWVHGVVPSGPYANDAYTAEKYATYTYSPWTYREFTCPVPLAPTCSVTLSPNPASYSPTGTATLTWSATNANISMYINNVGYMSGGSGSFTVPRTATTDYSCTAVGSGGTDTETAILTVTPPALPTATISSSRGTSMQVGQSATITATFSAASNDALSADAIDSPAGTHLTTTSVGSKTHTFTPNGPGTYTFYARATTGYYTSWATYATLTITVGAANPACTLSLNPTSITRGQSSALSWTSTNTTGGTISGVGAVGPNGSTSVTPSQTTLYTGVFNGPGNSTTQCNNGTGVTLTVTCPLSYSCSGSTIVRTNTDCSTTNVTSCVTPTFCSAGSSACLYPQVEFAQDGHLTALPSIVPLGTTASVHWNVSNVSSCTVSGTNGDSWTVAGTAGNNWTSTSGSPGLATSEIMAPVTYTLTCTGIGGQAVSPENATVTIIPVFEEV